MQQIHDTFMALPQCHSAVVRMSFEADRLRIAREHAGMSQQEAADALGITPQSISQFENGKRKPSTERIIDFCRIYHASADFMLGFVDKPNEKLQIKSLRPDQQRLLELYEEGKIPRVIRQLLGDPDFLQRNNDTPQIESGGEVDVPGKQKAS
jgi:transcriptional regulator with XRE-family HTH domain